MARPSFSPWSTDELFVVQTAAERGYGIRPIAALIHRSPSEVDLALWAMMGRRPIPAVLAELNAAWVGAA